MKYETEKEAAIDAARKASSIILAIYREDFKVQLKQPNDPVTDADKHANAVIVQQLSSAFPDDGIVAEESVPSPEQLSDQLVRKRIWFVDPLDGTKEFIARNGEFAVMIGLVTGNRPVLGVVAIPTLSETVVGVIGEGAWIMDSEGNTQPVRVSARENVSECMTLVSRSHMSPAADRLCNALQSAGRIPCGSVGVKIARIVRQQADIYVNPPKRGGSKLWDACAPDAVLTAAGGTVSDFSGKPINYTSTDLDLSKGYVATNGMIHNEVLRKIHYFNRESTPPSVPRS